MEYIRLRNSSANNVTLALQELPYPPHENVEGITEILFFIIPSIRVFLFIVMLPATLKCIIYEKASGMKKLGQLMGVSPEIIWVTWLLDFLVINLISIIFIVPLLTFSWGYQTGTFEYTNASSVFMDLVLYCISSMSLCLLLTTFMNSQNFTLVTVVCFWFISYFIPFVWKDYMLTISIIAKCFLCLIPNFALFYTFNNFSSYEQNKHDTTWEIFIFGDNSNNISLGCIFIMLTISSVVCVCLTIFVDWLKIKRIEGSLNEQRINDQTGEDNQTPMNKIQKESCQPKIVLKNVTMHYIKKTGLTNVSMDIYSGITVFVGSNGGGKTTILSTIAGMIPQTSGTIDFKHGYQKHGMCMQHDCFMPDISVINHLKIFGMINFSDAKAIDETVRELLTLFKLKGKEDYFPFQLSGGMRRKLSLSMALMATPKVLILDEPTTGIDISSRQDIWNCLSQWKHANPESCILITTHFMEEAEKLGDKIALLKNGCLLAYGSINYLKNEFEIGKKFFIKVNTENSGNMNKLDEVTLKWRERYKCKRREEGNQTVLMFNKYKKELIPILGVLEEFKKEGIISDVSLETRTLEDIFVKMNKQLEHTAEINDQSPLNTNLDIDTNKVGLIRKLFILAYYHIIAVTRNWIIFFLYVVAATLICLAAVLISLPPQVNSLAGGKEFSIHLNSYGSTNVLASKSNSSSAEKLLRSLEMVLASTRSQFKYSTSVSDDAITFATGSINEYSKNLLVAVEFNSSNDEVIANAMFSNKALHAASISVNLISNAVAKTFLNDNFKINAKHKPLPKLVPSEINDYYSSKYVWRFSLSFSVGPAILVMFFVAFPTCERRSKLMLLLKMRGIPDFFYWFQLYIVDFFIYLVSVSIIVLIVCLTTSLLNASLLLILFIYGMFAIPHAYVISAQKTQSDTNVLFFTKLLFSVSISIFLKLFEMSDSQVLETIGLIILFILIIVLPEVWLIRVMSKYAIKTISIYNWNHMNSEKQKQFCYTHTSSCCESSTSWDCTSYVFVWLNWELLFLIISNAAYYLLYLPISERRKQLQQSNKDSETLEDENLYKNMTFICCNITKMYETETVLEEVKFNIYMNQCFGLLGKNGAGKTTLLKILTEPRPRKKGSKKRRNAIIKDIKNFKAYLYQRKYNMSIGYLPQCDPLNPHLKVIESLTMFAKLTGVPDVNRFVEDIMNDFGLKKYEDILTKHCSGGTKRKISLAMALLTCPRVLILDEPTNGIDPLSRRHIWDILKEFKRKSGCILLTSHNAEEIESLCDHISVLSSSKLKPLESLCSRVTSSKYIISIKKNRKTADLKTILAKNNSINWENAIAYESEDILQFRLTRDQSLLDAMKHLEGLKDSDVIVNYSIWKNSLSDALLEHFSKNSEEVKEVKKKCCC